MSAHLVLRVPDMTCGHCENAVRSELLTIDGVDAVDVDLATKDVVVTGTRLVLTELEAAVDDAGYELEPNHS